MADSLSQADRWAGLTSMLSAFQDSSGGFPYSTVSDPDTTYQLSTGLSVSVTSWALLAPITIPGSPVERGN